MKLIFSQHAIQQMFKRGILIEQVESAFGDTSVKKNTTMTDQIRENCCCVVQKMVAIREKRSK